jgi:hypothetical protein
VVGPDKLDDGLVNTTQTDAANIVATTTVTITFRRRLNNR